MARFTREQLPSNISSAVAWRKIKDAIRAGNKSVEVLSRVVNGEEKWELRVWDGIRGDRRGSNAAGASENQDY